MTLCIQHVCTVLENRGLWNIYIDMEKRCWNPYLVYMPHNKVIASRAFVVGKGSYLCRCVFNSGLLSRYRKATTEMRTPHYSGYFNLPLLCPD